MFCNNAANYCSRQKPPGKSSAMAGGTNPAFDCTMQKYCHKLLGGSPLIAEDFQHHRHKAGDQAELQIER